LAHLKPGGILDVVMGEFNWQLNPKYPPRHTLRVVSLFKEALARRGVADASRHIIVLASTEGHALVPIVLKLTPFTSEEIDRAAGPRHHAPLRRRAVAPPHRPPPSPHPARGLRDPGTLGLHCVLPRIGARVHHGGDQHGTALRLVSRLPDVLADRRLELLSRV